MKTRILCYGDSNTWGYMPEGQSLGFHMRFPEDVRWPGALQNELGSDYVIIEEGLNGRTTSFDQKGFSCRNGLKYLESSLFRHVPIDVVVIFLGTNDLKLSICGDPMKSAESMRAFLDYLSHVHTGRDGQTSKVLLILPPYIGHGIEFSPFSKDYGGRKAIPASRQLNLEYRKIAERDHLAYVDASKYVRAGADGVHMTAPSHARLAEAIAEKLRSMRIHDLPEGNSADE